MVGDRGDHGVRLNADGADSDADDHADEEHAAERESPSKCPSPDLRIEASALALSSRLEVRGAHRG